MIYYKSFNEIPHGAFIEKKKKKYANLVGNASNENRRLFHTLESQRKKIKGTHEHIIVERQGRIKSLGKIDYVIPIRNINSMIKRKKWSKKGRRGGFIIQNRLGRTIGEFSGNKRNINYWRIY